MWNRSKYDVMADESNGLYMTTFFLFLKVRMLNSKRKRGKITEEVWNENLSKLYEDIIPYVKNISHVGYESYKDLEQVDTQEVIKFIRDNGESVDDFKKNYFESLNDYVKILLLLAIHDRDKVVFDSSSKKIILKIFGCNIFNYSIEAVKEKFNEWGKVLVDKITSASFDFRSLTLEEKNLLDNYHEKYMQDVIYPCVDIFTESNVRIMTEAKSLARRRS